MVIAYYLTIIAFCLLLPSCAKRVTQSSGINVKQLELDQRQQTQLDAIIQQEAMLVDVPIPLYDERIIDFSDTTSSLDTLILGYKSPLDSDQATIFFMQQMERYGWRHLVSFNTHSELMIQFESPNRYCTVLIKKHEQQTGCSIFIYIKKSEPSQARS